MARAAFYVKAIKPGALQYKQVRVEINKALKKERTALHREMRKTTASWTGKPNFGWKLGMSRGAAWIWVGPIKSGGVKNYKKWVWLDAGTSGHTITARKAPYLKYIADYIPKTRPYWIGSKGGGKTGNRWETRHSVMHHGNEPRHWSLLLAALRAPYFAKGVQKAVKKGMKWKGGSRP